MVIDWLKEKNNEIIENLKEKLELDFQNIDMKRNLDIQIKIQKLLEKDEALFFNIPIEDACKILERIVDKNNVIELYKELTSPSEYNELMKKFKV